MSSEKADPVSAFHSPRLRREQRSDTLDNAALALFSNRFMGIAEAMGNSLRHTSVSTNIKERLDFSCALFDPLGRLVSNAPHLPVHLGSMSFAVAYQIKTLGVGSNASSGDGIVEGDVLLTNSPTAGGSRESAPRPLRISSPVTDTACDVSSRFAGYYGDHTRFRQGRDHILHC